jgi:hypothetical protein
MRHGPARPDDERHQCTGRDARAGRMKRGGSKMPARLRVLKMR